MREKISRRNFLKGGLIAGAAIAGSTAIAACSPGGSTDADDAAAGGSGASDAAGAPSSSGGTTNAVANNVLTWLPEEPADPSDFEELSADIIIVGIGVAGACAARSATEEGCSVISIEKAEGPNCRSGDYAVVGKSEKCSIWKGRGGSDEYSVDPAIIVNHEMDEQCYYPKRAIYWRWAQNCGQVFDWFTDALPSLYFCPDTLSDIPDENAEAFVVPTFYPLPTDSTTGQEWNWKTEAYPTYPVTQCFGPSQQPVVNANWEKAAANGATGYFGHEAIKLIKEGDKVTSVFFKSMTEEKYYKAVANKAVILASGEYSSNEDILGYYAPETFANGVPHMWMNMDVNGNPTNTGDGLKMGVWAGAAVQQHHPPMIHYMGGGGIGTTAYLRLDVNGRRFMNEDVPGQQVQNATESIPERRFFTIFDSKWVEQIGKGLFAPQHGSCNYIVGSSEWAVIPEMPKNLNTMSTTGLVSETAVEDAVAASADGGGFGGATYKGDTIDALLAQFEGIDSTRAKASIEHYNELCAQGVDEDYGKPAKRMLAIENPPYYGFESGMSAMLVCPGGLCSNERGEVLDASGQHIEGLYACGNAQGSRYAVAYPIALRGVSHSLCMTYGYIVGKEAANAGSGSDLPAVVA